MASDEASHDISLWSGMGDTFWHQRGWAQLPMGLVGKAQRMLYSICAEQKPSCLMFLLPGPSGWWLPWLNVPVGCPWHCVVAPTPSCR